MSGDRGFWTPGDDASESQADMDEAILAAAKRSDAEVSTIVQHLIDVGQYYKAGRCLEIVVQHKLGLDVTGDALLSYDVPSFGAFHRTIYHLLRAGALYGRAGRTRTAEVSFRRALLFVEEALRSINGLDRVDNGEMACLGIAFELAGHCCIALDDSDGLDYYHAAERYWGQSARMRPEALFQWSHHPVTQTVIRCLGPVTEARPIDTGLSDDLFASDYVTRIDTARRLLA